MTNGQVNFVHDLVQMAKAFEELPQVRAELEGISARNSELSETIQRLELRIMDLKTELDKAHDATRKAEVERDHAERMFLETDDRLNAFQRLLRSFQTDANALVKASEPAPSEQVSVPQAPTFYPETDHGQPVQNFDAPATPAPASGVEFHGDPANVDSVSSGVQGSREAGEPHAPSAETPQEEAQSGATSTAATSEGVSVQPDPTPASGSSSENAWHGSNEANSQPDAHMGDASQDTSAFGGAPADPTASSPVGATPSPSSAPTDAAASVADVPEGSAQAEDDVGYHNEPKIDGHNWDAWDAWCSRMNDRYGSGNWPARPAQAAQ